ncbi:ATP-binding protein [bacterium]|nr:ATP-binding protein [bacterium]
MIVSVASGKGGTGKTTVAVSLAISAAPIALVDSDVEEPNANILLRADHSTSRKASLPFPVIDMKKCDFCEKCSDFCAYNGIVVLKGLKVFAVPEICKSCGGCKIVCPQDAISEEPRDIGYIKFGERLGIQIVEGELNIGESSSTPLVRMLPDYFPSGRDVIVDCPPGAAHPTVESLRAADFVLLVTEPTPFGIHDLEEALVITDELNKKVGLVVNRADIGTSDIENLAIERNIPILMRIPFSTDIAEHYSRGHSPAEFSEYWREQFALLWQKIEEQVR